MARAYRPLLMLATGCAIVVLPAACSGSGSVGDPPATTASAATFTCCEKSDIDPVRHPGETFELHWMMDLAPAAGTAATEPVVLGVTLSDGYQDVAQLKAIESGTPTLLARADDVTTSSAATTAPTSRITVPDGATPGFYNLTTTIKTGGSTSSGSAVIRVER